MTTSFNFSHYILKDFVAKFYLGINASPYLLVNYDENEHRHTVVTWKMVKVIVSVTSSLFAISATAPISYKLLNHPEPDEWRLPFEYR